VIASRRWLLAVTQMLAVWLMATPPAMAAESQQAGEWLLPRHDVRQSNFSPSLAQLHQPAVRWRLPVPSALSSLVAADVDLNGTEDLLTVTGGRLAAHTSSGTLLWQTPSLGLTSISGVGDLDGDGALDVVAVAGTAVYLLRLASGAVWWSTPPDDYGGIALAAVADFDGDGLLDLAVGDNAGPGAAFSSAIAIWRFAAGKPVLLAKTAMPGPDNHFPYGGGHQVLDVDGDEVADLLVAGYKRLGAFSGKTGAAVGLTPELPHLFLFLPVQRFVPKDQLPLLVWPASNGSGPVTQQQVGWYVLQQQGAELAIRWQYQAAIPAEEAVVLVHGSGADLDGDGLGELVVSHFADGVWRLRIYDLQTGAVLLTTGGAEWGGDPKSGPVLQGVVQQAGQTRLVVELQSSRVGQPFAPLHVASWSRSGGLGPSLDLGVGRWWGGNRKPVRDADARWKQPLLPLLALQDGQPTAGEWLVVRDVDEDGRADQLQALSPVGSVLVSGTLPPVTTLPGTRLAGKSLQIVLGNADGQVRVWDPNFALANDADNDGLADFVRRGMPNLNLLAGKWQANDPVPSLVLSTGSRLSAWQLAGAGPVVPPGLLWQQTPAGGIGSLNLADVTGTGDRVVIVGSVPPGLNLRLQSWDRQGQPGWQWSPPPLPLLRLASGVSSLLQHDVTGDGADDLLLTMTGQLPLVEPTLTATLWDGASRQSIWPADAGCSGISDNAFALDTWSNPVRAVASVYTERYSCDAQTGAVLAHTKGNPGGYGLPMPVDLDGEAPSEWLLGGSAGAVQAVAGATAAPLWTVEDKRLGGGTAALVPLANKAVHIQAIPAAAELQARAAKTGELLWTRVLVAGELWTPPNLPKHSVVVQRLVAVGGLSATASQPATGPVVLATTSDGWLYAVEVATGTLVWSWATGGSVGALAPVDVDGDGRLELVVGLPSGDLVALDGNVAAAPQTVRDVGTGPLADLALDLDQQESSAALVASWAAAPGASGYSARVIDDSGATVAGPVTTSATTARIDALYLQPGQRYRWAVSSYASVGADASFSAETVSDGVVIVDTSAPWWEAVRCTPACTLAATVPLQVSAVARDHTRLQRLDLRLTQQGAALPLAQESWPWLADRFDLAWSRSGLAPGQYTVRLTATDLADRVATAELAVVVCAPGQVVVGNSCAAPVSPPTSLNGSRRAARGCVAAPTAATGGWVVALAAAGAIGLGRRRSGRRPETSIQR
jgi:hypothetical protein